MMTWAPCPHGVRTRGKKESRGLKRSFEEASDLPVDDVVEQVMVPEPKTLHSFMSVIRHGAIRSWEEQNSALWQRAIRRWHALIESWSGSSPVVYEIQSRDSFKEQTQILVDIFFNKSASTLLKRCNSLARLTTFLRSCICIYAMSVIRVHLLRG